MNRKTGLLLFAFLLLIVVAGAGIAAPANEPDTLNVAWFYDINTLDPALAYDTASIQVITNLYDTLVTADPADPATLRPALATAWNVSADGLTYTFTVRPGVAFHNGALLTASDVAYSLQRGLLQSDPASPQWLFLGPIMGYRSGDITEQIAGGAYAGDPQGLRANADPAQLLATCDLVKSRVTADDVARTVTITLAQANGSFLSVLSDYGYVVNAGWAAAVGDWDGDCATWQNFYAPNQDQGSRLNAVANGTGGFRLESWTPGESIRLRRHLAYWGPRPPAVEPLNEVVIKLDQNSSSLPSRLEQGEIDMASLLSEQSAALDDQVLLEFLPGSAQPVLRHADGVLTKLSGIPSPFATDLFLNFTIATDGPRNYVGSGQLDGAGIPPDFFADSHVRKAFAYAFDYDAFNDFAYGGSGIRRTGPIVKPLMGYDPGQPVYDYNLTLAAAELAQAWGGLAAANGFHLTIPYNEGNTVRQKAAELLAAGFAAIDPKYQIAVPGIPWPDYLNDFRAGSLPVAISGWVADIAHPENWVRPYLVGTFAQRQGLPEAMRLAYEQQADACLVLLGAPARACYEALQQQAYADTATIYTFQPTSSDYVRGELRGLETARRANNSIDYSRLWKGGLPVAGLIAGAQPQAMSAAGAAGISLEATFPAGALSEPRTILLQPDTVVAGRPIPADLHLGRLAFSLTDWPAARAADLTFATPVEISLTYTAGQIAPLIEDGLVLMRWDGNAWVPAACGPVAADPAANELRVPICQTGDYALMGPTYDVLLPVTLR